MTNPRSVLRTIRFSVFVFTAATSFNFPANFSCGLAYAGTDDETIGESADELSERDSTPGAGVQAVGTEGSGAEVADEPDAPPATQTVTDVLTDQLMALVLPPPPASNGDEASISRILRNDSAIPRAALEKAFRWLRGHAESFANRSVMTIIDFNSSSRTKRMHVIDLNKLESERYLVAHGKGSGFDVPNQFSNTPNSNQSSLGVYTTLSPYHGEHGLSLKLKGLESTNNNAFKRTIVLHGADYVTPKIAASKKRLGRSNGCPAVDLRYSSQLVRQLDGGSLMLIYATNESSH